MSLGDCRIVFRPQKPIIFACKPTKKQKLCVSGTAKHIVRPHCQGRTHRRVAKIAKILALRSRKIPKILRKNDFREKYFFFIMRKVMLILRFTHSFGVLGCWERSKRIHFAIFRALGRSWTGSGWVGAESCPILGGSRISCNIVVHQFQSQPLHESF